MPMLEVTAPKGELNNKDRDTLMKRATQALIAREGGSLENPIIRANAWGYYREVPARGRYIGGEPAQTPTFQFKITTPEGVLNDESRAGLVSDIAKIVEEVIGSEAVSRHWVLLREIKDGGWGSSGRIIKLADLRAAARSAAAA